MGKFNNSEIHSLYSDWHWKLIEIDDKYRRLYVSDIDRLWIEYDFRRDSIVAVVDLKWEGSGDVMTPTEEGIRRWFESKGARYYVVYITYDFKHFRVVNSAGLECHKEEIEYADWLLSLRNNTVDHGFYEHKEVVWDKDGMNYRLPI
jgi:hypothetical protein